MVFLSDVALAWLVVLTRFRLSGVRLVRRFLFPPRGVSASDDPRRSSVSLVSSSVDSSFVPFVLVGFVLDLTWRR